MRVEWTGRDVFAHVAEALGVNTSDILASALVDDEAAFVLFTPAYSGDDSPIFSAMLQPDDDGILRRVGTDKDTGMTCGDLVAYLERDDV